MADPASRHAQDRPQGQLLHRAREAQHGEGQGVVQNDLDPVVDLRLLDELQKAVGRPGDEAVLHAELIAVPEEGQHGSQGDAAAQGHGPELDVREHEAHGHAQGPIGQGPDVRFAGLLGLFGQVDQQRRHDHKSACRETPLTCGHLPELLKEHEFVDEHGNLPPKTKIRTVGERCGISPMTPLPPMALPNRFQGCFSG